MERTPVDARDDMETDEKFRNPAGAALKATGGL